MPTLQINNHLFDIDAIAFDKDGTLIEFYKLWGTLGKHWVDWLTNQAVAQAPEKVKQPEQLRADLFQHLGIDSQTNRIKAESPFAVATTHQLYAIMASVLYQYGFTWHEAEVLVEASTEAQAEAPPLESLIAPLGDVKATLEALVNAGVHIAVITSDGKHGTEVALKVLDIAHLVSVVITADSPFPAKPNPAGLIHISQTLNVPLERMMMVGDSVGDMVTGRRAGVGACIGIVGGGGDPAGLAQHADTLTKSIDQIQLV